MSESTILTKPNIYDLRLQDLQKILKEANFRPFCAKQVFQWLYKMPEVPLENWPNVSKQLKSYLVEKFSFFRPKILWNQTSLDGTCKFLVGMEDRQSVEMVLIPGPERLTLCLSSQVGCAIGCTFCHTATQGLKRNLKIHEVIGQYLVARNWVWKNPILGMTRITNLVYMGQGEPLHNYSVMKKATEIFLEEFGAAISQRKITLSTSGLVPQIEKLQDFPPINIAISLHATNNKTRDELMPINKIYDLERLLEAVSQIPLKAHRRITYEYLLIEGFNDTWEDIRSLAKLLVAKRSKVNLIPFNEYPGSPYRRPSDEKVRWFQEALINLGLTCTTRISKGRDILAACGQLKSKVEEENATDGEEITTKKRGVTAR